MELYQSHKRRATLLPMAKITKTLHDILTPAKPCAKGAIKAGILDATDAQKFNDIVDAQQELDIFVSIMQGVRLCIEVLPTKSQTPKARQGASATIREYVKSTENNCKSKPHTTLLTWMDDVKNQKDSAAEAEPPAAREVEVHEDVVAPLEDDLE